MLTHIDEVPAQERSHGDIRATRQMLGPAAGSVEIGVSRWQIPEGARNAPAHVHATEEEIFYVLAGSGFAWHRGKAYPVGPGDTMVFRVNEGEHTVFGGPLDVLAFGEGSETSLTWLPRCNRMWAAPRYLPLDGPNPFKAEAAVGPLELPDPETERPSWIVNVDDVEHVHTVEGATDTRRADLGTAAGSQRSGLRHIWIAPGAEGHPPHCHSAEEEFFFILDGSGTLRLGEEEHEVRPGNIIARPAGTGVPHSFVAGDNGLTFLAYGQRRNTDTLYYPRSGKVRIRGLGGLLFRVESLEYWDGER
jgi:uncharacterized cupin superfamily protein